MPTKKSSRKTSARSSKRLSAKSDGFLSQIKWGESYTSLFLGAVVVIVALFLVFSFLKSRNLSKQQVTSSSTVTQQTMQQQTPKTYTVKPGDYLWSIAQKLYGSGYNWVDLANANNLQNPGIIYAGTKLIVPNVKPRLLTTNVTNNQVQQPSPIMGDSYTVVKGDYLWEIAVRAYNDGYKWVDIARVNNLANPDLIFSGNVLRLPR